MNQQTNLTDSQREALCSAWDTLCEHFDHVVMVYDTECKEGTDNMFGCNYYGGFSTAIGLLERAKHYLLKQNSENDPDMLE